LNEPLPAGEGQPDGAATPRIGVFGGAFDPPHNAHVALAQAAIAQFGLDALYIIPTGQAWHKARTLTAADDRLAMARLAFGELAAAVVDDREMRRAGPTFTIDTLEALQAEHRGAQLHLFMGADQFAAFDGWHRWQDILANAIICIAARALNTPATALFDASNWPKGRVSMLHLAQMPVSATDIRQRVAAGIDVSALVPPAVERYISAHHLYRRDSPQPA
jgi:nicotinate-nucleotide adenylyltransferase